MNRIVVVEANEIPPRLFAWYADANPGSTIARIMAEGLVGSTKVTDDVPREIYPSQTWASLGTGAPFKDHRVYWYGDPKPPEFPFYWQAAAADRTVGLVGVLHSSPLSEQCADPNVLFALPDAFADTPEARPRSLEALQSFNLKMTRANARVVSTTKPTVEYVTSGVAAIRHGLRPATAARLASTVAGIGLERTPKERLRTAQFELMSDMHFRLSTEYDPDLTVLFTNHVAAAMHRYWFSLFPDDWDQAIYDDAWVERHRNEIPSAMDSLDRSLARLLRWCEDSNRTLLVITSMGQHGGDPVPVELTSALIVKDARRFLDVLGIHDAVSVRENMVPHLTVELANEEMAVRTAAELEAREIAGSQLTIDLNGRWLTITYHLDSTQDALSVDGRVVSFDEAGLISQEVTDHRCGTHQPIGSMLVWNSPTATFPADAVDYLDVAPAILESLGVERLDHHNAPKFRL